MDPRHPEYQNFKNIRLKQRVVRVEKATDPHNSDVTLFAPSVRKELRDLRNHLQVLQEIKLQTYAASQGPPGPPGPPGPQCHQPQTQEETPDPGGQGGQDPTLPPGGGSGSSGGGGSGGQGGSMPEPSLQSLQCEIEALTTRVNVLEGQNTNLTERVENLETEVDLLRQLLQDLVNLIVGS